MKNDVMMLPDRGADLGHGCRIKLRYDVSREEFDAYVSALISDGAYRALQQNTIGENAYATLVGEEGMLHLCYAAATRTVRIITDTLEHYVLPIDTVAPYEKLTDTSLCVMSLDYTHREVTDGNGMCYVIILADGRYIIFDGGYRQDAPRLYQFLVDNNKRPDGKIVIAAWFMSHSHGDHTLAFAEFTERYADAVTLEYFVSNPAQREMFHRGAGYNDYLTVGVLDALAKYGNVKKIKPHSGQILRFCDAEFEIVYTLEDAFPRILPYMNDSSTVVRMKVAGQTVLFMGDCEKQTSDFISDLHGAALKSDIMQVNHHGYSGGTTELYQLVAPTYSMWTTSHIAFNFRTVGIKYQFIGNAIESNKYLFDTLGRDHCFVADGPCKILRLPLTSPDDITYYDYPEIL